MKLVYIVTVQIMLVGSRGSQMAKWQMDKELLFVTVTPPINYGVRIGTGTTLLGLRNCVAIAQANEDKQTTMMFLT